MKIYISADIEGVAGITNWNEAEKNHPDYPEFRERMTEEVVAACDIKPDALERFAKTKVVARFYDHELIRELYAPGRGWVWHELTGGKKQTNAGAISSGCAGRWRGASAPCFAALAAGLSTTLSGVQTGPGATQFTRIRRFTKFCASDLVKVWMAPFVAE